MTPEGIAFFAALDKRQTHPTPEELAADMERRSALAAELMDADPRLSFMSAIVIAGDKISEERSKRWVAEGLPGIDALTFVGSFAALDFAVWAVENGHLAKDVLLDRLADLWSSTDPDDTDPRFLALWVEAWERNGRKPVLQNPAKPLPRKKVLRVYRGQDEDSPLGIAWSLDPKVAEKFARGAGTRQSDRPGVVIFTDVPRDKVLGFCPDRGESEVILPVKGRSESWMK